MEDIKEAISWNTPLMYATIENRVQLMDKLIEIGCDINAINKVGMGFVCCLFIYQTLGKSILTYMYLSDSMVQGPASFRNY